MDHASIARLSLRRGASTTRRRSRRRALAASLVLATTAVVWAQAPPPQGPPNVPPGLAAAVAAGQDVAVIVGLATPRPLRPEVELTAAEIARQRTEIAQIQRSVAALLATAAVPVGHQFEAIPFLSARINAAALAVLQASPFVSSIHEDRQLVRSLAESSPLIRANVAWSAGYGGAGWSVAVLDDGVDKAHPFLSGKVVSEACYSKAGGAAIGTSLCPRGVTSSTATGSATPCVPDCQHGTHVAGIAAGRGSAFSGVARDASLIAVTVFTRHTDGALTAYESDILAGLQRVLQPSDDLQHRVGESESRCRSLLHDRVL